MKCQGPRNTATGTVGFGAIVAADIAGYARLIGADEEGTLAAFRAHRKELVDSKLVEFGGWIANTAGDSLLIEFASVVDAVRCILDVQRAIAARNAEVAAAVVLVVLLAIGAWQAGWLLLADTASTEPVLSLPTGPTIVMLAFDNMSDNAAQEYFVDGLTEDLTTGASRYTYLFVIARNSAFKYKGKGGGRAGCRPRPRLTGW